MKVAIIGAGHVGSTLGGRWAKAGHEVVFGVRDPAALKVAEMLSSLGAAASAKTVGEASALSEVVVLTVPWEGAQDAVQSAGDLTGKILIDVTNPLTNGPDGMPQGLAIGLTTSAGEQVAQWAPGAHIVKAFNTTGFPNMANPQYGGAATTMLFCGDDAGAKQVVAQLGHDLGFEMVDAGPLTNARLLEPLAMLWIDLALHQGLGVDFAFHLVRR